MRKRAISLFLAMLMVLSAAVPAMAAEDGFTVPMEEAAEAAAPMAPEALPAEPAPEAAPDPVPAEPEQAEEPMPVDVPAPVDVGAPEPGKLSVSFQYHAVSFPPDPAKDTFNGDQPILWISSDTYANSEQYTYKVTYPGQEGSESLEAPEGTRQIAGTTTNILIWNLDAEKVTGGIYTVSAYAVGADTAPATAAAIGQVDVYRVNFHAGQGHFDESTLPTTPEGGLGNNNKDLIVKYGRLDDYLTSSLFNVPAPIGNEGQFLGWSAEQNQKDYTHIVDKATVKDLAKSDKAYVYDAYAAYGEKASYEYELQFNGGKNLLNNGEGDPFKMEERQEYGATTEVKFTLVNTGNRPLTDLGILSASSRLEVDRSQMSGTLGAGDSWTIGITPKNDLPVGHYNESITFHYGRRFQTVWLAFDIQKRKVELTVVEPTKKYGQVLSAGDIKITSGLPEGKTLADIGCSLDSTGFSARANAGDSYKISLVGSPANYEVTLAGDPHVTVEQAAVVMSSIHALTIKPGKELPPLEGKFYTEGHLNEPGWEVTGDLAWADPSKTLDKTESCNWVFTPKDGNHTELRGQYQVIVSSLDPTEISLTGPDSFVYNGQPYGLSFTTDRAGDPREITVEYKLQTPEAKPTDKPTKVGTYDVTAHVNKDDQYAEDDWEGTMTITQRELTASVEVFSTEYRYNGESVIPAKSIKLEGVCGEDKVKVTGSASVDPQIIGTPQYVSFQLELGGEDSGNYTLKTITNMKRVTILPKVIEPEVTVTGESGLTKVYGYTTTLSELTAATEDILAADKAAVDFTFSSRGTAVTADVGEYEVYVTVNDNRYAFPGDVRTMTVPDVKLTVTRATPTQGTVTAGNGWKKGPLSAVNLSGSFHHPEHPDMLVKGTFKWDDDSLEEGLLPEDKETYEATWTFTPNDSNYKSDPIKGSSVITLVDQKILPVTAEPQTDDVYNGKPQEYTNWSLGKGSESYSGEWGKEIKYRPVAEAARGVAAMSLMSAAAGPDDGNSLDWSLNEPANAGVYDVCLRVWPVGTYEYAEEHIHTTMTIQKATPTADTRPVDVAQGTLLENITPRPPLGVDEQPLSGTYLWTQPGDTPVTQDGVSYDWIFSPVDTYNYMTIRGSTTINLLKETRLAKAQVFNLPGAEGDYARLDLEASALTAGDVVTFYSDSACTDPVSEAHTVAGSSGTEVVLLEAGALAQTAGTIYARISGFEAKPSPAGYPAEPGFTVKTSGSTSLKAYTEGTVPVTVEAGPGYTAETAKFAGDANLKVTEDSGLGAKLQGDVYVTSQTEALLTVEVTVNHPDQVGHPGETITLTKTVTVTVIPGPVPKPPSGGGGGGVAPSPSPSPSTSPSPSPSPTPGPGGGEEPPPAPVDPPKTNNGTGWSYDYDTGEWYFFKKEELVANYWVGKIDGASQWDKNWYYVGPDGRMLTGMQYNDHGEIGKMLTDWQWVGGDYGECYFSKKNGEAGKCTWSEKLGDFDPVTGQWTGG